MFGAVVVVAAAAAAVGDSLAGNASAVPTNLKVNYMTAPLDIDSNSLHFTWSGPAADHGTSACKWTAARVVVRSAATGATACDSGVMPTTRPSLTIRDTLKCLESDRLFSWTVTLNCADGSNVQSDPATFGTGLLDESDWGGAHWIRGGKEYRKVFVVAAGTSISRAALFIGACQYYNVWIDGVKIGSQVLAPWTAFGTTRSYDVYHIDPTLLAPGNHAIAVRVGQGFCSSAAHDAYDPNAERSLLARLALHGPTEDAVVQTVVSDSSWSTCSDGPIVSDSTYYGESYDARAEQPGWTNAAFEPPAGKVWAPAVNLSVAATMSSQGMPPVSVVREIPALSMRVVPINTTNQSCTDSAEGGQLSVACPESTITAVTFFSYGLPEGSCGGGLAPNPACNAGPNLTEFVTKFCVGQESCAVSCIGRVPPPYPNGQCTATNQPGGASATFLEGDPCDGVKKRLVLQVSCAPVTSKVKYVYDFGQEFAGVVRVSLPAGTKNGTVVTLKHAEALAHPPLAPADGSVWMGNLFWANPVDVYTAKGGGNEIYQPSFTYHGFRYVEMTVAGFPFPEPPTLASMVGINLRSAVDESGGVVLGHNPHDPNNLLQKLSNNSWWTEAAALMSIPAGAAGRGERNGWSGDAAFACESETFDFDTAAFFSRYLESLITSQLPDGEMLNGWPPQGATGITEQATGDLTDPSWSAVLPEVAYHLWKSYGCEVCLDNAWPALLKYYSLLEANFTVTPHTYAKWGDWNPAYPPPGRTPDHSTPGPPFVRTVSSITGAAMVVQNFIEAAEMAAATGRDADAARFQQMLPTLRQQYHESFYDPIGQIYGDGTPTAFATALWLEVTPPELLPAVVDNFVAQLHSVDYRMDTVGFIGVRYIFEALGKVNRTDVALKMLQVTAYPSFGYQITNPMEPATSLWESYDEPTMPQWVDESSRDHHYSASINTYLRKYLGGLDQPSGTKAWDVVKCRPEAAHYPTLLSTASASLQSHRGPVSCSWSVDASVSPPPAPPPVRMAVLGPAADPTGAV